MTLPAPHLADSRRELVLKENKTTYRAKNPQSKHLEVHRPDKDILPSQEACDYLILVSEREKALFIELKGSHYHKACRQILSTCTALVGELPPATAFFARIVIATQPAPRLKTDAEKSLMAYLKKRSGRVEELLVCRTGVLEEEL